MEWSNKFIHKDALIKIDSKNFYNVTKDLYLKLKLFFLTFLFIK